MNRKYTTDTELLTRLCGAEHCRGYFVQLIRRGEKWWYRIRHGHDALENIGEKIGPFWCWREAMRTGLVEVDELLKKIDGSEENE